MIGSTLTEERRNKLCNLLQQNLDVFAWKPADMTGVPRHIAEHRLNVSKDHSSVRQKKGASARQKPGNTRRGRKVSRSRNHEGVEEAFKQMKQLIYELPMLVAPMEKEELIVYLAATKETVSAVLMTEREAKQMPIYFVSRALRGPKVNYTSMEKLVLALVHASKGLKSRTTRRGISGYSNRRRGGTPRTMILFMDGSSCTDGSGAGLILTNPKGMEFTYALRFRFDATNNKAEYEALIARLKIAEQMGVKNLQANVDSRLVANQVNGTYVAKENDMVRYLEKVKTFIKNFKAFSIIQVPRSENKKADALSKIASTSFAHLSKQVQVEELKEKSISTVEVLAVVEEGDTWMTPIFKYLMEGTLLAEVKKARGVKRKSWRITLFVDLVSQEKSSRIMENNSKTIRSKTVEKENRSLGEGIKARLDERSKNWMEELPHVLWAHRTMIKSSNRDTLFSLTYETEAVIPAEIGMPTLRTTKVDLVQNDEALEINLDLLEERREQAAIREAKKQSKDRKVDSKNLLDMVSSSKRRIF
ncbi:reverse transcriptase domain-containing protein [Tanacetum coccineum]